MTSCICTSCGSILQQNTQKSQRVNVVELLLTNDPPREHELTGIREAVAARTVQLEVIDGQISVLATERNQISQDLSELKQVSSSVRRIPYDIWSEIFLAGIEEDFFALPQLSDSLDVHAMPWVLLRVCSRWRRVALSFSRLWSTMCLDLDQQVSKDPHAGTIPLLDLYLQRSRAHSLNIFVHCSSNLKRFNRRGKVLQVLLTSSSRWKWAGFALPSSSFKILGPVRGVLRSLQVLFLKNIGPVEETEPVDAFRYAPLLRDVYFCNISIPSLTFSMPWSQLTTVQTAHDNWIRNQIRLSRHIDLLRRTPLLEEYVMQCITNEDRHSGSPVTLSRLRHLGIGVPEWGVPRSYELVLKRLTAPELTTLHLELHHEKDTQIIIPFLEQSQCSLTTLIICMPNLLGNQLLNLLKAVPSLEELHIIGPADCLSDEVVASLKYPSGVSQEGVILPCFEHLLLDALKAEPRLFIEMIESRTQIGQEPTRRRLLSVLLLEPVVLDPELRTRLEDCCSRGLEFDPSENRQ